MGMQIQLSQRAIFLISLLFLAGFVFVALSRSYFTTINLDINAWAASIQTRFITDGATAISITFDTAALVTISLIVAAVLFIGHHKRYGVLLLGSMAGDALLVLLFKTLILSPRPWNEIIAETGNSFPSGHTMGSVVFFGVLTYVAWTHWRSAKVKASTAGLYVAIVAVVGFDRIYLNVHWFNDVLGAIFLGAFWLMFSIVVFNKLLQSGRFPRFLLQNGKQKAKHT